MVLIAPLALSAGLQERVLAQTEKTHETRITTPEESSQSRHIRDLINQLPDPVPGAL